MDAAMKQTVSFQGKVLFWSSPDNSNKLCHRCGKLGCAPNFCPLKLTRKRTCTRDLQDHSSSTSRRDNKTTNKHNNNNNNHTNSNPASSQHARHNTHPLPHQTLNSALSLEDANNILNLLHELQCEVANFHKRIFALKLADQQMTWIESHLGLNPIPTPNEPDLDLMQEDAPISHVPFNIQPSAKSSSPPKKEINDLKNSRVVIESKLDLLTGSIHKFISSIGGAPPDQAVTLPLSTISFNISSFNVNGLKMHGQTKIEQTSSFFSLKHISFGGIVDTHLHPKQMKFLSKHIVNYTIFSLELDTSKQILSSGGVSLFIENSLASHVQDFKSHSSHKYYPIYFNLPQLASKHIHRLFYHLLSHGYEDYTPINLSDSLGTFHHNDQITRVDYVWSCPLLKGFAFTACIFDAQDICTFDHNPRQTCRVFKFESVTESQWTEFTDKADVLCDVLPSTFSSWHINQMCEYLQSHILKAAKATLPSSPVGNNYTPKIPKELEILTQHYQVLNRLMHSIRLLRKYPLTYSAAHEHKWSIHLIRLQKILHLYKKVFAFIPTLPVSISSCRQDDFKSLLEILSNISKSLRGFHLLQEKEFKTLPSVLVWMTEIIILKLIFLLLSIQRFLALIVDIDDAVVDHFQNFMLIKSNPPTSINALPDRWSSAYQLMDDVSSSIYDSLMNPYS
ncbi:hypothetical protein RhiirC2_788758 [Rhizophagus irregularis]|uniref:Uncharacterized protein n=1 Tax=Rhizophagus irregularis TaxID=588596 RepID=A0A2N1MPN0_9GLOM|nr:hypothetical protein RhiirC2_788758 [Rhizophagus irregularis]